MRANLSDRLLKTVGWLLLSMTTLVHSAATWSTIGPDLSILGGMSAQLATFVCNPLGYLPLALPTLAILVFGWWQIFEGLRTRDFLIRRAILVIVSWGVLCAFVVFPFLEFMLGIFWHYGDLKARLLQACLVWC